MAGGDRRRGPLPGAAALGDRAASLSCHLAQVNEQRLGPAVPLSLCLSQRLHDVKGICL